MSEIKTPEQIAEDLNKSIATFKEQVENSATKEEIDAVNTAFETFKNEQSAKLEGLATSEALKDLEDILAKQGETISQMKNGNSAETQKGIKQAIKSKIEENKDAFKQLKDSQNGGFTVETKAAANMLVSTNTTGRVERYERDTERTKPVRRNPFILDLVNVSITNASKVTYVEREAPDGNPGMTAEGAVKPLIDFDYVEREASVKKMTAVAKMSKEMMDDVDGFVQDTEDELLERLNLLFDEQLLSGDGTGQNLTGIEANATPFAAGSFADTIATPNNYDVLKVALNQVALNNFDAGVIITNPSDVVAMELERGTDGHYIMPPFSASDGTVISGVRVVSNNGVTAGDFIVGDLSKFKVKVREGLNIDYGHENDDFRRNLLTALCEGRATAYIPNNHFGAIVKGDFTTAKAALVTP